MALREIAEGLIDASILSLVEQEFTIDELAEDPVPDVNSDTCESSFSADSALSNQPSIDALPDEPIPSAQGTAE